MFDESRIESIDDMMYFSFFFMCMCFNLRRGLGGHMGMD
jgi:hypothetical protein